MKVNFTPHLSFSVYDLTNIPLKEIIEQYEKLRVSVKETTGYYWDNSHLMVSDLFGGLYAFGISPNGETLTLYNPAGNSYLGEFKANNKGTLNREDRDKINEICENYMRGNVPCSVCGKFISINDIAGSHFASIYCKDCFKGQIKEAALNETYN